MTRDEEVAAELGRLRENAIRLAAEKLNRTFTYDVTFIGDGDAVPLTYRVEAKSPSDAITVAIGELGPIKLMGKDRAVQVAIPNLAAEAKHAEEYAPLYAERFDAICVFEAAGFVNNVGTAWYKHEATGLTATIDPPEAPIGSRFAGVYMHRVDEETGKDQMYAWALIPWYGDGAWHERALELLRDALHTATM